MDHLGQEEVERRRVHLVVHVFTFFALCLAAGLLAGEGERGGGLAC